MCKDEQKYVELRRNEGVWSAGGGLWYRGLQRDLECTGVLRGGG